MSLRALATKHHVSRRTVGKALQSEIPPPRKKIERQPTVLLGLREHIEAMLEANPAIAAAAIWQRLHDEHDATPSYPPSAPTSPPAEQPGPKRQESSMSRLRPRLHAGPPTLHPHRSRKKRPSGSCTWRSSKSDS